MPNFLLTVVCLMALVIFGVGLIGIADNVRPVPRCAEDEVLVGVGEYEGGRWQTYQCGPSWDDYEGFWLYE